MGRKIFLILFFIFFSLFIYNKWKQPVRKGIEKEATLKEGQWETYLKHQSTITSHPSTQKELKSIKVEEKISEPRFDLNKKIIRRYGKPLIGTGLDKYKEDRDLAIINKVNKNWKKILTHDLLRFQKPETKLFVKDEGAFIRIRNNQGRHVNQVSLTFKQHTGMLSSYRALIDAESGKIIETWDHSRFEYFKGHDHESGIKPDGHY